MENERSKPFEPHRPVFNDDRSTLSDFLWGQTEKKGSADSKTEPGGENAIASSRRHTKALKKNQLRPEEYYTESQPMLGQDGLGQSDVAVESRQISKEEFPQG